MESQGHSNETGGLSPPTKPSPESGIRQLDFDKPTAVAAWTRRHRRGRPCGDPPFCGHAGPSASPARPSILAHLPPHARAQRGGARAGNRRLHDARPRPRSDAGQLQRLTSACNIGATRTCLGSPIVACAGGGHGPREGRAMKQLPAFIVLLAAAAGVPAPVSAQMFGQMERYELGQRLHRFELAWQAADAERRGKSVPAMEAAVSSFFRLQLAAAGRSLDQAYLTVLAADPSPAWNWALSQRLQVDPLVADASETTIRVRLHDFYASGTPEPTEARIALARVGCGSEDADGNSHRRGRRAARCRVGNRPGGAR